jgi:hypothetical protein
MFELKTSNILNWLSNKNFLYGDIAIVLQVNYNLISVFYI